MHQSFSRSDRRFEIWLLNLLQVILMLPEMTCRLSLKGTATSANILLKSPSISNMVWVSSDGLDSYNILVSGDGMVSDGDGWLGVGPIRGLGVR
jgi:hypothetical protein